MKLTNYITIVFIIVLFSKPLLSRELKIGYFGAPPFVIITQDMNSPRGVVIDMWEKIAKELGHTVSWRQMTIARLIHELENDKLDASALFVPTPDRKALFHFAENKWDYVQPGIAVKLDSPLKELKVPQDLANYRVGYTKKSVITPWFKSEKIKFINISGTNFVERLLRQLLSERIDAVYWPSISGMKMLLNKLKGSKKVRFLRSPLGPYPIMAMFPKTQKGKVLVDKFDDAFVKVDSQFDFSDIKTKYIEGFNIFNIE